MERSLFKFIWRFSSVQQIMALVLTLISFPFLYVSLDLPKTIINKAISGDPESFPASRFGFEFLGFEFAGIEMGQITYLLVLCGFFLMFVFINGGFKFQINTYKGIMAERLLRRLRYILLDRILRFPLPQFQKMSQGEVVSMVAQEVEPLGGFFGDSFVMPAFQGGIFATIMIFMFAQDPWLGLAAFAMIPVQGYIIPKLQKKVNLLGKERVKNVRALSARISEVVGGIQDVHSHDISGHVMADMSARLSALFWIRFDIYKRKFFMKFINNFLNQLTPFFFFSVGGYLAISGDLSVGALVAALSAYKDLAAPWKELLGYYNRLADTQIKYDAVVSQFAPQGMLADELQLDPPSERGRLDSELVVSGLSYVDEDGVRIVEGANFTVKPGENLAILGSNGTAKEILTKMLGRLQAPSGGRIKVGGEDIATLHEAVTGSRIGVMTPEPVFFNASIATNTFLGLQNRTPEIGEPEGQAKADYDESVASGNSPYPINKDWTNYESAQVEDSRDLLERAADLINKLELSDDLYAMGLRQTINSEENPDLAGKLLLARQRMRETLDSRGLSDLVQPYDFDQFNTYSSVGENILFGEPTSDEFAIENLGKNTLVLQTLDEFGLRPQFQEIGLRCAELMVDLFQDLPPGHAFFEQYSFVDEETLPDIKTISRAARQDGFDSLEPDEQDILIGLPFRLIPQRHRLGLINTDEIRDAMVKIRHHLYATHGEEFTQNVQKFDSSGYNDGLNILDNILFGRIVHGHADASDRVLEAVTEIVDELDLWHAIIETAFDFTVGINGSKLSAAQRQKIAVLRTLLKRPDIVIVNEALGAMDAETQARVVGVIGEEVKDTTLIWIDSAAAPGLDFHQTLEINGSRLVAIDGVVEPVPAEEVVEEDAGEGGAAIGAETRILRELPLFANMDPSKLRLLAFTSERITYEPGDLVVKQGDAGDSAFVVLSGQAEVILENDDGGETILYQIDGGQVVGELAMLCDTPRSATVRAHSELVALKLNREVFVELARQDPYFSFEMTRDLGRRLLHTTAGLNARS